MNDEKNGALYAEYKKLADAEPKVIFGGRLGEYRYYDMDQGDPRRPWREQGWKRANDTFFDPFVYQRQGECKKCDRCGRLMAI